LRGVPELLKGTRDSVTLRNRQIARTDAGTEYLGPRQEQRTGQYTLTDADLERVMQAGMADESDQEGGLAALGTLSEAVQEMMQPPRRNNLAGDPSEYEPEPGVPVRRARSRKIQWSRDPVTGETVSQQRGVRIDRQGRPYVQPLGQSDTLAPTTVLKVPYTNPAMAGRSPKEQAENLLIRYIRPDEAAGVITVDADATTSWLRDREESTGERIRDLQAETRTPVINARTLDQARREGRFRLPTPEEAAKYAPKGDGEDTLVGIVRVPKPRPIPSERGGRQPLDVEAFARDQAEAQDDEIPVYNFGGSAKVETVNYDPATGREVIEAVDIPLFRLGSPTQTADPAAMRAGVRQLLSSGAKTGAGVTPKQVSLDTVQRLLDSGQVQVIGPDGQGRAPMAPTAFAELVNTARLAAGERAQQFSRDPASLPQLANASIPVKLDLPGGESLVVQRPDGSLDVVDLVTPGYSDRVIASIRDTRKLEPSVPAFASELYEVRKAAEEMAAADPTLTSSIYDLVGEMTAGARSESAPVISRNTVVRRMLNSGMTPAQVRESAARAGAGKTELEFLRQDLTSALNKGSEVDLFADSAPELRAVDGARIQAEQAIQQILKTTRPENVAAMIGTLVAKGELSTPEAQTLTTALARATAKQADPNLETWDELADEFRFEVERELGNRQNQDAQDQALRSYLDEYFGGTTDDDIDQIAEGWGYGADREGVTGDPDSARFRVEGGGGQQQWPAPGPVRVIQEARTAGRVAPNPNPARQFVGWAWDEEANRKGMEPRNPLVGLIGRDRAYVDPATMPEEVPGLTTRRRGITSPVRRASLAFEPGEEMGADALVAAQIYDRARGRAVRNVPLESLPGGPAVAFPAPESRAAEVRGQYRQAVPGMRPITNFDRYADLIGAEIGSPEQEAAMKYQAERLRRLREQANR
jgi:hypothetical protein